MFKEMAMRITFLGAAGTVTGSKYLLEHRNQHVLILVMVAMEMMQWELETPPKRSQGVFGT